MYRNKRVNVELSYFNNVPKLISFAYGKIKFARRVMISQKNNFIFNHASLMQLKGIVLTENYRFYRALKEFPSTCIHRSKIPIKTSIPFGYFWLGRLDLAPVADLHFEILYFQYQTSAQCRRVFPSLVLRDRRLKQTLDNSATRATQSPATPYRFNCKRKNKSR